MYIVLNTNRCVSFLFSFNQVTSLITKIKSCSARGTSAICWHEETEQIVEVINYCCDGFKADTEASGNDCLADDAFIIEKSQVKTLWKCFQLCLWIISALFVLLIIFLIYVCKFKFRIRKLNKSLETMRANGPLQAGTKSVCSAVLVNPNKSQPTVLRNENIYTN